MPLFIHAVTGPFAVHGQAVELTGKSDGKIADIDHFLYFAIAFLEALSHFIRYQSAKGRLVRAEGFADLSDDLAATGRGPAAPFGKGVQCGLYDRIITRLVSRDDGRDPLAIHGRK